MQLVLRRKNILFFINGSCSVTVISERLRRVFAVHPKVLVQPSYPLPLSLFSHYHA